MNLYTANKNSERTIMDELKETNNEKTAETPAETEQTAEASDGEYTGMSKGKAAFLKILPMLIVLVCTGLFMWGIKFVIGIFYAPHDEVFTKESGTEKYVVVQCTTGQKNEYYLYDSTFVYNEEDYNNVAGEHEKAHTAHIPLAGITLPSGSVDVENAAVKLLTEGNGVTAYQFGEFIIYRLEGEYGSFAPLREYSEAIITKNKDKDKLVIRQILKNEAWKDFEMPYRKDESFERILDDLVDKIEADDANVV